MKANKIALLFLLSFGFKLFSQNTQDNQVIPIGKLVEAFPEESVIINESTTTYKFITNDPYYTFVVNEEIHDKYVGLKQKTSAVAAVYYDKNSEITSHKVSGTGSHDPNYDRICSDYEMAGIFHHDGKVCRFGLGFDRSGEYMTVKIKKSYINPLFFSIIPLHRAHAVFKGVVRIEIPYNVDIDILEKNFEGFNIMRYEEKKSKFRVVEYTFSEIPSSLNLQDLPDYSCTFPHLMVNIKSYESFGITKTIFETEDDLKSWYLKQVPQYSLSDTLAAFTEKLVDGLGSDSSKIESIYKWINNNIRYIAFSSGPAAYVPDDPNIVFKKKFSDCKGMAILAQYMLKKLNYDARLAWVYSGNGCHDSVFKSLHQHNHMICALKQNDRFLWIDPTMNYSLFNEIPITLQDKEAYVQQDNSIVEINITKQQDFISRQIINNLEIINTDIQIVGQIDLRGLQREKLTYFTDLAGTKKSKELISYFLKKGKLTSDLDSVQTYFHNDPAQTFSIKYKMLVPNAVIKTGEKYLLNLNYYDDFAETIIDTLRKWPLEYEAAGNYFQELKLHLPEGFSVMKTPAKLEIDNEVIRIVLKYIKENNMLVYTKEITIKQPVVKPTHFKSLEASFRQLHNSYREMIILTNQPKQ